MNQAETLLATLSEEDIQTRTADMLTEEHIIIGNDRRIIIPNSLKRLAVQYDHDIETVTFDCPRYWDEHDMSLMAVYVNYACPNGKLGSYPAKNVRPDDTDPTIMHFEWTISRNVTQAPGALTILVCVKNVDADGVEANHWNSEICTDAYISKGLESAIVDVETNPDILTQVLMLNTNILNLNTITLERATVYVGTGEMPDWANVQIDPEGTDGNDIEGDTVKIIGESAYEVAVEQGFEGTEKEWLASLKGEKGDKGDPGGPPGPKGDKGDDGVSVTHSWNGTTLTVTSASGTSSADLKGEKGDKSSNPNLIDNWYFADPVNQRGKTEYTGAGYTIDRWALRAADESITIESDGIVINAGYGFTQLIENESKIIGKTVTFSVLMADGRFDSATINSLETVWFGMSIISSRYIIGSGMMVIGNDKLLAVKLELGSVQTLAYQDENGNWILNDPPPDKGMELLKCIQSTADPSDGYANKVVATTDYTLPVKKGYYTGNIDELYNGAWLVLINTTGDMPFTHAWFDLIAFPSGTGGVSQIAMCATGTGVATQFKFRHRGDSGWSSWSETATTDYALNKAGDTVKGALSFASSIDPNGWTSIMKNHDSAYDAGSNISDYDKNAKNVTLCLKANQNKIVFYDRDSIEHDILHTGNKPSGSYTGNGDATERTIEAGGIGDLIFIHAQHSVIGFACYYGGVMFNLANNTMQCFTRSSIYYENGVLCIASNDAFINHSGTIFYYQVL